MADKTLVVVESPAKAKTINKYLGSRYIVKASVGHIKDLITYRIGVDVDNGFVPKYVTIRGKGDIIKELKQAAKTCSKVMIATDPDREGEAIAWHLAEEIKKKNTNVKRVLFNEITKTGVKKGLKEPIEINESLFMSQQARRVMDRLIGYKVSPFLSRAMLHKTDKALSAGRVQSVALRLICERDEEVNSFVPIDYWSIQGDFQNNDIDKLNAKLVEFDGKLIKNPEGSGAANTDEEKKALEQKLSALHFIKNEEEAKALIERIKKENYSISDISKKKVKRNPFPPFTTSSLQQEASKRLGFSNKKTMMVAQKLYEGVNMGDEGLAGLITYMRTDSVRLSPEAEEAAREHISKKYGKDYLPPKPPQYKSKSKSVQDAHEAIRPTVIDYTPDFVRKHTDKDQAALYELIYNRFLASQMSPAQTEQTTVSISGGDFVFRATGSVILFNGFLAVYQDIKEENGNGKDNAILPNKLEKNAGMELKKVSKNKSQTKSRPRYTEASLVKELDELGIGRPSTYASIISTLTDREYVNISKKTFAATELGRDVNEILVKNFPDLFNVEFTVQMEDSLDTVADNGKQYVDVLNNFYSPFTNALDKAEKSGNIPEIPCDECGAPMVIRVSRRGRFLGCSKYPDCTFTKPLPSQEKKEKAEPVIAEGVTCDICGKQMVIREGRFGKFYGCIDYPTCKGIKPIVTEVECPKCHEGKLIERYSQKAKKKFWGCSNYPKCDHITNYEPINKKCPSCGHYFIEYRFKKVKDGYEKYIKCPECKENFELSLVDKK